MTRTVRLLASASGLAVAALGASPAFAAGTASGSTITNTVSLNYQVGGVAQPQISASDSFIVDRKINLTVVQEGAATTSVSPGQTNAITTFLVTNTSNATLDLNLAVSQLAGGVSANGGTDNFDATNVRIYEDTNANGVYNAGVDLLVSYLDSVVADATRRVFVLADIPIARVTNDVAGVRLSAAAHETQAAATVGAVVTQTAGANTAGVDTVFADTNANGNTARDGIHFGGDDYTVLAAALTASKTSRVISDPFNGTTNPKLIPGAVVEYCIAISNAAGAATATNVAISDSLPAQTLFDTSFTMLINGTTGGPVCSTDGVAGGSQAGNVVTATLSNIAASQTRTVLFRATVQ